MSTPQSSIRARLPLTERNTPNENEWLHSLEKELDHRRAELERIREDSCKQLSEKLIERKRKSPGVHLTPKGRSRTNEELVRSVASSKGPKYAESSPLSSEQRGREHSGSTLSRMTNEGAHTTPISKRLAFEERVDLDALEQEKEELQSVVEQTRSDMRKAHDDLDKRDRIIEQLHALQMDRDRECHDLKEDVKRKVEQMRVVEDKLGVVMSERDHLSALHRDWELRIRDLQAEVQRQKEELTATKEAKAMLARDLDHQNNQLEDLQRCKDAAERENRHLQERVRHNERDMASLRDEITKQTCNTSHDTEQYDAARDERIAALERELEEQRRRSSRMEAEARQTAALQAELDAARSLEEERQQEMGMAQELRTELEAKERVISSLRADVERAQHLNEQHAMVSTQVVHLQHDLSTRGQELSELRLELEQAMLEKSHVVALEQQRTHEITRLQACLIAMEKEKEEAISEYDARLQHEIAAREDSLRKLGQQVPQIPEVATPREAAGLVETIRAEAGSLPLAVIQEREAMLNELARYKRQVEALEDSIKERDAILAEKEAQLLEHEEQRAIAEGVIVKVKNYACRILNQRSHHIIRRQIMRVGFSGLWRSRIAHLSNEIGRLHGQMHEKDRTIGDLEGRLQDLRTELADQVRGLDVVTAPPQLLPRRSVRGVNRSAGMTVIVYVLVGVVAVALGAFQLAFSLGRGTFCSQDEVRLAM